MERDNPISHFNKALNNFNQPTSNTNKGAVSSTYKSIFNDIYSQNAGLRDDD